MPQPVAVWRASEGWFWDIAEDSGGFDRISPEGPHDTRQTAEKEAVSLFGACIFLDGPPSFYGDHA